MQRPKIYDETQIVKTIVKNNNYSWQAYTICL